MEIIASDARNLKTRFHVNRCKFKPPFLWTPGGQISVYSEAFLCHLLKGQHLWKWIHIGGRLLPQTFVWCNFSPFASFLYIMKNKQTYLECDSSILVTHGTARRHWKCFLRMHLLQRDDLFSSSPDSAVGSFILAVGLIWDPSRGLRHRGFYCTSCNVSLSTLFKQKTGWIHKHRYLALDAFLYL